MIVLDLSNVLCFLFQRCRTIKRNHAAELDGVSLGEILQHIYSVILFEIVNQSLPISSYTGIVALDCLEVNHLLSASERTWFISHSVDHLDLEKYRVHDCVIVGSFAVISVDELDPSSDE